MCSSDLLRDVLVRVLSFSLKSQKGSHEKYEGMYGGRRRIVTLDKNHDSFPPRIQKQNVHSMALQAGMSKSGFIGLIKKA